MAEKSKVLGPECANSPRYLANSKGTRLVAMIAFAISIVILASAINRSRPGIRENILSEGISISWPFSEIGRIKWLGEPGREGNGKD